MSTFEMVCWAVIVLLVVAGLGGIVILLATAKSPRGEESELLVLQADEEDYRAGGGF